MRPGPTKPLLALRRAETHAVCDRLGITPALDASNDDPSFRRNRVRHELIPLIDTISERDTVPLLTRLADLLRADDDALDALAESIDVTDARALATADRALASRAVRAWLTVDGLPPDSATVDRVLAVANGAGEGTDVGGGRHVRRSRQRLHLESPSNPR